MTLDELESVCIDFGDTLHQAIAEKESTGEMELTTVTELYAKLSEWNRHLQELCTLVQQKGIDL